MPHPCHLSFDLHIGLLRVMHPVCRCMHAIALAQLRGPSVKPWDKQGISMWQSWLRANIGPNLLGHMYVGPVQDGYLIATSKGLSPRAGQKKWVSRDMHPPAGTPPGSSSTQNM